MSRRPTKMKVCSEVKIYNFCCKQTTFSHCAALLERGGVSMTVYITVCLPSRNKVHAWVLYVGLVLTSGTNGMYLKQSQNYQAPTNRFELVQTSAADSLDTGIKRPTERSVAYGEYSICNHPRSIPIGEIYAWIYRTPCHTRDPPRGPQLQQWRVLQLNVKQFMVYTTECF